MDKKKRGDIMDRSAARRITEIGVLAALYTVLTLVLPVASFGPVQVRPAEALAILPVFAPMAIPGLTLGCFLANLIGLSMGANVAGAWDLLFGTAATLAAAGLSYAFRSVKIRSFPWLSLLPPIFLNGLVVGTELYLATIGGQFAFGAWALFVGEILLGEGIAVGIGGSLLFFALRKWFPRRL